MVTVGVVKHHNAFHPGAVDQQREVVGRAFDGCGVVVLADGPANDDPGTTRDFGQHHVQNLTAHVVKVNVNAFGAMLFQPRTHVGVFVVNASVKAQLVDHPVTLGFAARNTDHAATLEFGNLPHGLAHSACCA